MGSKESAPITSTVASALDNLYQAKEKLLVDSLPEGPEKTALEATLTAHAGKPWSDKDKADFD